MWMHGWISLVQTDAGYWFNQAHEPNALEADAWHCLHDLNQAHESNAGRCGAEARLH